MLKGIDPLIGPELLFVLAQMGHGDSIVIADANFPSASLAKRTVHGRALQIDCPAPRAVQAVLSLIPVDTFDSDPVLTMQVVGDPAAIPEVVFEAEPMFAAERTASKAIERHAFYRAAGEAFAILRTAETRIYANFIIRKGVVQP